MSIVTQVMTPSRVHVFGPAERDDRQHRALLPGERYCDAADMGQEVVFHRLPVQTGVEWVCALCGEMTVLDEV